ncbi:MAG: glycosyltransferase, partial [Balneolaceae bacterium]
MPNKPLLSVAIVVQNQRDVVETTLTTLYELTSIPFELFLIDDGSTDGSDEVIQSLLDYYQHEQTFYFSHQQPGGRGNALNEALVQCNGQLFWAPETIQNINEQELSKRLEQLSDSTNAAILQQYQLPQSHQRWLDCIRDKKWPLDGVFIWNLRAINASNRFFSPYLGQYNGLELAARLSDFSFMISDSEWFHPNKLIEAPEPDPKLRQELLLTMLRKTGIRDSVRTPILNSLHTLGQMEPSKTFDNEQLNKALHMMKDGRFNSALELTEGVLGEKPDHPEARKLKIQILEKKRRFVEASELKHEISKSKTKKTEDLSPGQENGDVQVSLIIPTAAYGKPALEHCLLSVSDHCDTAHLELIVIDNASLDDTHDYLDELREKKFLNCRIITNEQNMGFATSVNQGLKAAKGEYACIMHNDIEFKSDAISHLCDLMDAHPRYAIIGPTANKTLNPDQAAKNTKEE